MDKEEVKLKIQEIETQMAEVDFWQDKQKAQETLREYNDLKEKLSGVGKYDKGDAVITIFAGAGGDDAEDFAYMLFNMYQKYFARCGFESTTLHQNENDHGGFRNITFEVHGK
ncbi:MAG: PCRF domain-containing protein, partial [Candidatus Paceibacterota bacterium]